MDRSRRRRMLGGVLLILAVIACFTFFRSNFRWGRGVAQWHNGVRVTDIRVGSGLEAKPGRLIEAHYAAYLPDGREALNTRDRSPHTWRIGDGSVVTGMDLAVRGMRPGGIREAHIPYTHHFGRAGLEGSIPETTPLRFRIEMLKVQTGPWLPEPVTSREGRLRVR